MPVSAGYNLLHEVFEKPQLPAGLLGNEAKNPVFAKSVFKADRCLRTTGYVLSYSDRRGSNENPKIIRFFFHLLSFAALPTLPGLCTIVINPVVNVIHILSPFVTYNPTCLWTFVFIFSGLESFPLPLTAPEMQALQLTGSVGSGSSIQSDSMCASHQTSVQQVLEMLKRRQPADAGK